MELIVFVLFQVNFELLFSIGQTHHLHMHTIKSHDLPCDSHMTTHLDSLLGTYSEVLGTPGGAKAPFVIHVQQVTLCINDTSKQNCLILLLVVVMLCKKETVYLQPLAPY